ncbi:hypothetical protein RVR_8177 [Actinacidiphila reveromycinica]|uniref:Amidohydrolase-related domain-containing protein n=1 Tax=Actinacidiphila reveromycinica TaxID=659352 RepID=A0A7U3UY62_9ACTN|nr:amidohydrolase family protein [Streptomyces sp. SN-593]BBB00962.1 hypothetical protein RVR_8177 [Streptomyces sp. SN-593]
MIIDSQVHVWRPDAPAHPWPPGARDLPFVHRLDDPLGTGELVGAMDGAGVDMAVLVPPSFAGDSNELVRDAVAGLPDRFLAFGRLPLHRPIGVRELAARRRDFRLTGFRLAFNQDHLRRVLAEGGAGWLWQVCERLDIPVMVLAAGMEDALEEVARAHPGLRITLDHLNLGTRRPTVGRLLPDIARLAGLAACPNVSVKASALPNYLPPGTDPGELAPAVLAALELFGADRVFWGSDLSRLCCPYAEWLDLFRTGLPGLSPAERASLLGDGIARWLGLGEPAAARTGAGPRDTPRETAAEAGGHA